MKNQSNWSLYGGVMFVGERNSTFNIHTIVSDNCEVRYQDVLRCVLARVVKKLRAAADSIKYAQASIGHGF